jgi:hypothetical protein
MIADTIHREYSVKPGSQHIASLHACRGLEQLIGRYPPKRVLELGAGIGTLTDLMLQILPADTVLVTLEDHSYCLEQMRANVGSPLLRATLVSNYDEIGPTDFDLVVVDGGRADASVMPFVAPKGLVFVEGFRAEQRKFLEDGSRAYAAMNVRAMDRGGSLHGPNRWGGAYWVYRFEPTLIERARFATRHSWDSLLVTRRRALKGVIRKSVVQLEALLARAGIIP